MHRFVLCLYLFGGLLSVHGLPRIAEHLQHREETQVYKAQSIILYDQSNDLVLYEKNADMVHSIASLTKIITVYLALEAVAQGGFALHAPVTINPRSYARAQPPGSSLLFLGPGQRVTGLDLLYGLTVSSGNDAAHALAEAVSGSVEQFVQNMNERMQEFGYTSTSFVDSSGLGENNESTARELADLTARLYQNWESATIQLFSRKSFRFPHDETGILQYNRNTLLGTYPGADGLKTGYTEEAGYTFVGSVSRNGRRIILVMLGLDAPSKQEGYQLRHEQALALFDSAFNDYLLYTLSFRSPEPPHLPSHGGKKQKVALGFGPRPRFYLHEDQVPYVEAGADIPSFFAAPIQQGDHIATIHLNLDGQSYAVSTIEAAETIEREWFGMRFLRWIQRLFYTPSIPQIQLGMDLYSE